MKKVDFLHLDDSIESFAFIKQRSEAYWEKVELNMCWGFQIQEGSKWKNGLSEKDIQKFEKQVGIEFPAPLKNFYRTMNGLDKPGLNNNNGEKIEYGPTFYAFPEDVEKIKSQINWILEDNNVSPTDISTGKIPAIFPFFGHRFLICDANQNVLSMYGNDIIFWASNLSQGIAKDIFPITAAPPTQYPASSFWNNKAML